MKYLIVMMMRCETIHDAEETSKLFLWYYHRIIVLIVLSLLLIQDEAGSSLRTFMISIKYRVKNILISRIVAIVLRSALQLGQRLLHTHITHNT